MLIIIIMPLPLYNVDQGIMFLGCHSHCPVCLSCRAQQNRECGMNVDTIPSLNGFSCVLELCGLNSSK